MKTFERLLIEFTNLLCRLMDVTPDHIEKLRQKDRPLPPPERRWDTFEA